MYKKIILSMVLIFCLAGCAITPKSDNVHNNASQNTYIKSVFIAYYELEGFTKNNDEKTFKKEISKAFKELADKGFNRVTVQDLAPMHFINQIIFLQVNICLAIREQN